MNEGVKKLFWKASDVTLAWVCNVDFDPRALTWTQLWYPLAQTSLSVQIKPLQGTRAMCSCVNLNLQCHLCEMEPADPSLASNGSRLICNIECNSSRKNLGKRWKGMQKVEFRRKRLAEECVHRGRCYALKRKSCCTNFPKLAPKLYVFWTQN